MKPALPRQTNIEPTSYPFTCIWFAPGTGWWASFSLDKERKFGPYDSYEETHSMNQLNIMRCVLGV